MKIYLASSWRNETLQQAGVGLLRSIGHEVYDVIHPPGGDHLGFSWADVDPEWRSWTPPDYIAALNHPIAQAGFESDFGAMRWADAGVLLLPCGRSAHLEAGYFVGAGKPLWVVIDENEFTSTPAVTHTELMYLMATGIFTSIADLMRHLDEVERAGHLGLAPA